MEPLDQHFIDQVSKNYPINKDKILSAYKYANQEHSGVKRKSGEPYIIHPVAVAEILIENNMDYQTIMAALLHDVVEDTERSLLDIEKKFGKTVAKLVDGVTKISEVTADKNLTEDDSLRRLLMAMGNDVRVIFIKLADRLHNMRTIKFLKRERQIAIANETKELFIPIAERIGIRSLRSELQLLDFECLFPEECEEIKREYDRKIEKNKTKLEAIEKEIGTSLMNGGVEADITAMPAKYYSIYRKRKSQGISKVYGLRIFKIIVPSEEDCYKALWLIHKHFKPIPGQFHDYIASPKRNGYQSLHSVVISTEFGITFNVLIRTPEMNNICENGILAMWKNKDSDEVFDRNFEKYNKIKAIIYGEKDEDVASSAFINAVKTDLSQIATWVLTPKLKPISIDSESPTAIDYAYAIHTSIGNNAVGAVINGKKSSLASTLSNGDVVEILLSPEPKSPSRNWLTIAKTTTARKRMREYFNRNLTEENISLGKKLLLEEISKFGYTLLDIERIFPQTIQEFGFSKIEELYAGIGYKSITIQQILNYLQSNNGTNNKLPEAPVLVEGVSFAPEVIFSKCCCPILGDEIVAVKSKNNISIHTINCVNLKRFEENKIYQAGWKKGVKQLFNVNLKIIAKDERGLAAKVLGAISKEGYDITKLFAKSFGDTDCQFDITVKLENNKQLASLIEKLSQMNQIKLVNRSFD